MGTIKNTFVSDLHLVCGKDDLRPSMQCIHFKNGYAYASDAYMFVKQPIAFNPIINADILDGVAIHADSFKAIRRMQVVTATEDGFECVSKDGQHVFFEYAKDVTAPDYDAIIPKMIAEATAQIGLKPKFIGILSKAMAGGSYGLKMELRGADKAIVFHPLQAEFEDEIGLVMPMMLS